MKCVTCTNRNVKAVHLCCGVTGISSIVLRPKRKFLKSMEYEKAIEWNLKVY